MNKNANVTALNGDYWKPLDTQNKRRRVQRTIYTEDHLRIPVSIINKSLSTSTTQSAPTPEPVLVRVEQALEPPKAVATPDDPSTVDSSPPIAMPDSPLSQSPEKDKAKRVRKSPTLGKAYYRPNKAEQLSPISEIPLPATSSDTTATLPTPPAPATTVAPEEPTDKTKKKKKRKTPDTPAEAKQSKKKTQKSHRVHGLRLDEALAHVDNMDGWSEARKKAYAMIDTNPNMYYYRFNAPGEAQRNGHWSSEEKQLFFKRMNELGGIDYKWGIFSMAIPGRVGYQCANFYRKLIKDGEVKDSNYTLDDKGEPVYIKPTNKDTVSSTVGHSEQDTPKVVKKKEKKEKKKQKKEKDPDQKSEQKEPKEKKAKKKKPKVPPVVSQEDKSTLQVATESQPLQPVKTDLSSPPKKLKQTTIMESLKLTKGAKPTTAKSEAAKARKLLKKKQAAEKRRHEKKKEAEEKKKKDIEDKKRKQEELERFYEDDVKGKEVLPRLFIGNKRAAQNKEWLQTANVRFVLNITKEVANFYESEITYKRVGIADSMDENAKQHFEDATSFIRNGLTSEGAVLVHCAEGKSRSATFTLAYLLICEQWDLKKAVDHLSSVSNININDGFKQQLMEFEKLLGRDAPLYNFFTGRRSPLRTSREVPNQAAKKPLSSSTTAVPQVVEIDAQSLSAIPNVSEPQVLQNTIVQTETEDVNATISPTTLPTTTAIPVESVGAVEDSKLTKVKPPTQIIEAIQPAALPKLQANPESEEPSVSDPMFWGSGNGENSNNTSLDSLGTDEKVLDDWLSIVIQ